MVAPIPGAVVTCEFGTKGSWAAGYHTGRDYRAQTPLRVNSTAAGRVVHAGTGGWGAAYGIHVIVESRGVRHLYAHLSSARVRMGQTVSAGEQVGVSGATGRVFGPHLHYEERVSPYGYANHRRPQLDAQTSAKVNLDKVVEAFKCDPDRRAGDGLHPKMVRTVEHALAAQGLLANGHSSDGYAGTATREAYRKWQRVLGFSGKDADGIPGAASLEALGAQHGFTVTRAKRTSTKNGDASGQGRPRPKDWCGFATRDVIPGSTTAPWSASANTRWKGLLHTTEGSSYAGARASYLDGGVPHFTVVPDFKNKRVEVYQHFPLSSRATALKDPSGTPVKENRAKVIQIECVGTCDERNRGKWQKGLFVEDWPVWYLNGVRKLMRWIEQNRPVPQASDLFWKPYDSGRASGSYGLQNGVRLPCGRFNSFAGWLGHQHASGNDHGDPGRVDIDYLLR